MDCAVDQTGINHTCKNLTSAEYIKSHSIEINISGIIIWLLILLKLVDSRFLHYMV